MTYYCWSNILEDLIKRTDLVDTYSLSLPFHSDSFMTQPVGQPVSRQKRAVVKKSVCLFACLSFSRLSFKSKHFFKECETVRNKTDYKSWILKSETIKLTMSNAQIEL